MLDIESLLKRWQTAGVLDAETATRIRAHESLGAPGPSHSGTGETTPVLPQAAGSGPFASGDPAKQGPQSAQASLKWLVVTGLILGAILLACGVVLFVNAHWDQLGPTGRFLLVLSMVALFHVAGGFTRSHFEGLSTTLHAVGTISTGAAIALVGQIFNIQEHWPAAVLLWAVAAWCGWLLLRDQAQQTLALLLLPAWIFCELEFRMEGHIGEPIYVGRLLFVWAILYLTFFAHSRRKVMRGILSAISAIGAAVGIYSMLSYWESWSSTQSFIPFGTRVWAWTAIAALPLVVAAFHGHKGLVPIAVAIAFVIVLPWCYHSKIETYNYGGGSQTYTYANSNLIAHLLVAAFAVFFCWWGMRLVSRPLVNLGILGFAASVLWFYWSDLYNKLDRSLGLIGLGVLFLAGGWALEKMRRRILARMAATPPQTTGEMGGAQ